MIKSSIEKVAEDIGFDIGNSDDVTQSNLLNGFCRALNSLNVGNGDLDMQLCYLSNKCNKTTFKILKKIVDFIELNNETKI